MLVDSHCHLDYPDFENRMEQVRADMAANGVTHALCISTNLESFPRVHALAERYGNFYATAGVHPDQEEPTGLDVETLVALAMRPKVVGIGETGLDYYRLEGDLDWQRERFRIHIRAARRVRKPLVIHTRSAAEDTLRIMAEEGAEQVGGVLHCFTESMETAQAAVGMGFHVSFSGIVTFKNAADLKQVARSLPLDRILVETDSPYLAPVPFRGRTNHPALVRYVAEEVARLRGLSLEALAEATTANFFSLFSIPSAEP
jgi:TatD DNase family protein